MILKSECESSLLKIGFPEEDLITLPFSIHNPNKKTKKYTINLLIVFGKKLKNSEEIKSEEKINSIVNFILSRIYFDKDKNELYYDDSRKNRIILLRKQEMIQVEYSVLKNTIEIFGWINSFKLSNFLSFKLPKTVENEEEIKGYAYNLIESVVIIDQQVQIGQIIYEKSENFSNENDLASIKIIEIEKDDIYPTRQIIYIEENFQTQEIHEKTNDISFSEITCNVYLKKLSTDIVLLKDENKYNNIFSEIKLEKENIEETAAIKIQKKFRKKLTIKEINNIFEDKEENNKDEEEEKIDEENFDKKSNYEKEEKKLTLKKFETNVYSEQEKVQINFKNNIKENSIIDFNYLIENENIEVKEKNKLKFKSEEGSKIFYNFKSLKKLILYKKVKKM